MKFALFLGCTRRKRVTSGPMRAIDVYCGGVMAEIRNLLAKRPDLSKCVFILSAKYGLIQADEPIETYDDVLTASSVSGLRHSVALRLQDFFEHCQPVSLFVFAEPLYFSMLSQALDGFALNSLTWEPDVHSGGLLFLEKLRHHVDRMQIIEDGRI